MQHLENKIDKNKEHSAKALTIHKMQMMIAELRKK